MGYGELGLDLLQTLKTALGAGKQAASNVVLSEAGKAVADSAAGKAAIKQQAKANLVDDLKPYLIPAAGILAIILFMRRGRR